MAKTLRDEMINGRGRMELRSDYGIDGIIRYLELICRAQAINVTANHPDRYAYKSYSNNTLDITLLSDLESNALYNITNTTNLMAVDAIRCLHINPSDINHYFEINSFKILEVSAKEREMRYHPDLNSRYLPDHGHSINITLSSENVMSPYDSLIHYIAPTGYKYKSRLIKIPNVLQYPAKASGYDLAREQDSILQTKMIDDLVFAQLSSLFEETGTTLLPLSLISSIMPHFEHQPVVLREASLGDMAERIDSLKGVLGSCIGMEVEVDIGNDYMYESRRRINNIGLKFINRLDLI